MATFELPRMSEVEAIVTRVSKAVGFPLGLFYGATAQNPVTSLSVADFEQRIVDTIAEISGFHLTLGGHTSTLNQTFKPTGFLNKGFWGYLAIWAYSELGLPYAKLFKDLLGNFFIGYSVGGFFDPATVPQPAGYSASYMFGQPATFSFGAAGTTSALGPAVVSAAAVGGGVA